MRSSVQSDGHHVKFEGFLSRLSQTATPKVRQRVRKPAPETRCVDLFLVLRMLVVEYREEQAHRCVMMDWHPVDAVGAAAVMMMMMMMMMMMVLPVLPLSHHTLPAELLCR